MKVRCRLRGVLCRLVRAANQLQRFKRDIEVPHRGQCFLADNGTMRRKMVAPRGKRAQRIHRWRNTRKGARLGRHRSAFLDACLNNRKGLMTARRPNRCC